MDQIDRLSRGLGWFSIGVGLVEILAPGRLARALGLTGKETLLRAYGIREIASGMVTLSADKGVGLWSRVAGDALDIASLMPALNRYNPQRGNAKIALATVGITALDLLGAMALSRRSRRIGPVQQHNYQGRSGFPKGLGAARAVAGTTNGTRAAPMKSVTAPAVPGYWCKGPPRLGRCI